MKEIIEKIDTKKMIYIVVGIIAIVFIFYLLNVVGTKLFTKSSYDDVEDIMKSAAISYYRDNDGLLPNTIGNTVEVEASDLVSGKYMKDIAKYIKKKNVTCTGKVKVTNVNGNFRYNPILDCGDEYKDISLADYIKTNTSIVESGNGLYSSSNGFAYRGDDVQNYVKFGDNTYRIVKIENDHIVLIYTSKLVNMAWDDRYNVDKNSKVGINDYSVSRIKDYLQDLYNGNTMFSEEEKLLISNYNLATGKRIESDTDKTNSIEGSVLFQNQYIGLLTVSDYLNASLDENCTSSTSVSCINYNYLMDIETSFWTVTADKDTSYKVFKVDSNIGISLVNASSSSGVQPVIYLVSDAIYTSGDGTEDNPYQFR